MTAEEKRMKLLERRANVVRSRLLRTVDALDNRRHQVTEIGVTAKEAAPRIGLSVLGVIALSAGAILGLRAVLKSRRERVLSSRAKRLFCAFRLEPKPSPGARMFEKLGVTVLTVLATEGTRRAMKNVLDGRFPDGRLAVGGALEAHHRSMNPTQVG